MQGVLKGRHLKVTDGKSIEQKELEAPQISHRGNAQLGDHGAVAKNEEVEIRSDASLELRSFPSSTCSSAGYGR